MNILVLEPHFDDTAYSMAGLLLSGMVADDVLVVTVFSRSEFAPYAAISGVDQVSARRLEEHKKFCQKISVMDLALGYDEAPQRGWSMDSIFDHLHSNDAEEDLKQSIMNDLLLLKEKFTPGKVYAPLGICGHIDHVIVRECAESVFASTIHFYEDLPYAGEINRSEYNEWIKKLTGALYPAINPDVSRLGHRLEYLKMYSSQVAKKDLASVRNYLRMHPGDRFWSTTTNHE